MSKDKGRKNGKKNNFASNDNRKHIPYGSKKGWIYDDRDDSTNSVNKAKERRNTLKK